MGEENNTVVKGAATGAVVGVGVWGLVGPAVQTLGFMSGGIAGGSTAASMMSAAALAHAGSVASGSTVAALQSIGAVGVAVPVGAGLAAVGAAVGAAAPIAKAYRKNRRKNENCAEVKESSGAPFARSKL
ncbi:unnamed protein product [Phytophthora fragariaefolia]|uniref:Unnamed protein product n=1 Tax=Phytophthora fragariaefolia TaxID=1490495 RepID=A0A9W7CJD6_9STRA|nr:unnamed protein product [Phytophthora fragariaefolia]